MSLDPLHLMNRACTFPPEVGVPPYDERWHQKIALLCEYAAALKKLYDVRTRQYRARCQGTIRDTKLESELVEAANDVERIERFIGLDV